ncbi:hypothetical protein, partial [Cellulomonas sp. HZM]|uniref:hypothetical protein n=1 Tax=Cellulomonas sp. HZM TaxID=1454010 RepID=UPI000493AEEF
MTTSARPGSAALPRELAARWRALSTESVWLRASDWHHPAVDAMAKAVVAGQDLAAPAWELGRARGDVGVGVEEAIDDVACLFRAVGEHPPLHVVRALSGGWADAQAGTSLAGVTDAESGLPSVRYLAVRVREAAVREPGSRLVVVDVAAGPVHPLVRAARSAAVGTALLATYGDGHPLASLGGGVFAALVGPAGDDDEGLAPGDRVEILRRQIARRTAHEPVHSATRCPVRVWTVAVPDGPDEASTLVARLARP